MEFLTVVFSAVVAISTVVYAALTWKLTEETRLMRRAGTQPGLSVHIESGRYVNAIFLVIPKLRAGCRSGRNMEGLAITR